MPRDTSNSGRTSNSGSMSGGSWGGGGGAAGGVGGGGGGNLRGADGMTASQRAQTRDSRLGLTTGNTWHGNTAFGRSGQAAMGFAQRQGPIGGMGPQVSQYSNFRNPDGSQMFPGAGMQSATGRNPFQAGSQIAASVPRPAMAGQPAQQPVPQPAGAPPYLFQPGLAFDYDNVLAPGVYQGMFIKNPTDEAISQKPAGRLTKDMLPGLFGGGVAPQQYTSMRPWPGQSAIPNNPPVYKPAPQQYTSMRPWPGQSAIPNNPPVYKPAQTNTRPVQTWSVEGGNGVTGLTGLSLPGLGKLYHERVPRDASKLSTSEVGGMGRYKPAFNKNSGRLR